MTEKNEKTSAGFDAGYTPAVQTDSGHAYEAKSDEIVVDSEMYGIAKPRRVVTRGNIIPLDVKD